MPLVVASDCGGGRAGALVLVQLGPRCTASRADDTLASRARSASSTRSARRAIPTAVDDSRQRSLDGVRPGRRAARAAGRGRRRRAARSRSTTTPREQISANSRPDRVVLVARPRALLAGAQARRLGARRRHRLADPGRLRHLVGHEHGHPGRGRRRGAAAPAASRPGRRRRSSRRSCSPRGPSSTTPKHEHPTSVLAAGGGMIDVQAADAPRLFAAALRRARSGCCARGTRETRTVELSDAGGGAGTWTVSAPGLDAPPSVTVPAGGSQKLELTLSPPGRSSNGNRSGNVVLTSGTHTRAHPLVGLRRAPAPGQAALAAARGRALGQGRHARGHARSSTTTAGPPSPRRQRPAAPLPGPRAAVVVHRARRARATPACRGRGRVVPQILLARDENRLAGEPALPLERQPVPRDLRPLRDGQRRCSCRPPGRYYVVVETRPGHKPGPLQAAPLDRRSHPARRSASVTTQYVHSDGELRFHVPRRRQRGQLPGPRGAASTARRRTSRSPRPARSRVRVGGLEAGPAPPRRSRPPTCRRRRTPRTPRRSRCPNTRTRARGVHRGREPASLRAQWISTSTRARSSSRASASPSPRAASRYTPSEARAAAAELGGPVVVKAQVLTGGRGKAGGVKLARRPTRPAERAGEILGLDIRGHVVRPLWIERASDIDREYYFSITFDRAAKRPLFMLTTSGGVDIEEVADEQSRRARAAAPRPARGLASRGSRAELVLPRRHPGGRAQAGHGDHRQAPTAPSASATPCWSRSTR